MQRCLALAKQAIVKILITGATGFIGKALTKAMLTAGYEVSIALRKRADMPAHAKQFMVGDFANEPDFSDALNGVDCVVHLAGKAHIIDNNKAKILADFRKINTDLTHHLAKQAVKSGVKRLIFLSSIGVNGNQNNKPFLETDTPNPQEPYAISKYEAEQSLLQLATKNNLEVVIIRPPLVYGNNAPGNFGRLLNWAKNPVPLPLGAVHNVRSLVALDNLVDFIILCTHHQKAKNEIFLIADGQDLSTTQLLQKILTAFNKKTILVPMPTNWMVFAARLIGKQADAVRLFSSLQVDNSKATNLLDWRAKTTLEKQLEKIAKEVLQK